MIMIMAASAAPITMSCIDLRAGQAWDVIELKPPIHAGTTPCLINADGRGLIMTKGRYACHDGLMPVAAQCSGGSHLGAAGFASSETFFKVSGNVSPNPNP